MIRQTTEGRFGVPHTIADRDKRYGDFAETASISQLLQHAMHDTKGWSDLDPVKKEALTMIQVKVARILNGDPDYPDNWHDIQGYAKLAEDSCVELVR